MGCWRSRALALTALAASAAYSLALLLLPDTYAMVLLRAWAVATVLAVGWVLFRIEWLQCPPPRSGRGLEKVAKLPPG